MKGCLVQTLQLVEVSRGPYHTSAVSILDIVRYIAFVFVSESFDMMVSE
jgi:hypothetical protein